MKKSRYTDRQIIAILKEALNESIGSAELAERPGFIRARKMKM